MVMPATSIATRLPSWRIRKVLEHIDAHLHEDISVADLSALLDLSEGYFSRAFRTTLGHPPHTYIVDRRLSRAKEMIRTSARSLAEIAQACGFCDQPHLTKCFRRSLGMSPAAWRRAQRAGSNAASLPAVPIGVAARPASVQGAPVRRTSCSRLSPSIRAS
jgi:transcriptional regulator GlxA family with amidase domain